MAVKQTLSLPTKRKQLCKYQSIFNFLRRRDDENVNTHIFVSTLEFHSKEAFHCPWRTISISFAASNISR